MIQGVTLEAVIAECGDLWNIGRLCSIVSAYVILSRVKTAHGLLLLRAFAATLFQQGEPPGLWCLRKLLQASSNSNTGLRLQDEFIEYSPGDAEKE